VVRGPGHMRLPATLWPRSHDASISPGTGIRSLRMRLLPTERSEQKSPDRKLTICVGQRPVICSSFSGYRAPSTLIFDAALSIC
jgi:hypothetical protein